LLALRRALQQICDAPPIKFGRGKDPDSEANRKEHADAHRRLEYIDAALAKCVFPDALRVFLVEQRKSRVAAAHELAKHALSSADESRERARLQSLMWPLSPTAPRPSLSRLLVDDDVQATLVGEGPSDGASGASDAADLVLAKAFKTSAKTISRDRKERRSPTRKR
jgi:hypothetical protein